MGRKERFEDYLSELEFVEWDRFLQHDDGFRTVFGWIEREDEYKDFVAVLFTSTGQPDYFVTSSPDYSSRIGSILFDEDSHVSCQRVENYFNVDNCVTLGKQQSLETGGKNLDE